MLYNDSELLIEKSAGNLPQNPPVVKAPGIDTPRASSASKAAELS